MCEGWCILMFGFGKSNSQDVRLIGYCAARFLTNKFTKYIVSGSRDRDFYIISVSAGLVMFLLQPFVSSLLWKMVL